MAAILFWRSHKTDIVSEIMAAYCSYLNLDILKASHAIVIIKEFMYMWTCKGTEAWLVAYFAIYD